jgi:hypothetical protein
MGDRKYVSTRPVELFQIMTSLAIIYWNIFGMKSYEELGQYAFIYSKIAGLYEGIRLIQLLLTFGYVTYRYQLLGDFSIYVYLANVIFLVVLRQLYGNVDYSKYPDCPDAPFHCGFKTVRSSKYGNEVFVYYPITKNSKANDRYQDVKLLPHGNKTLKGLAKLIFPVFDRGYLGPILFRHLLSVF